MADLLGVKILVLVCLLGPDFPVYCSSAITTKIGSPSHSELEGHDLHRVNGGIFLYYYAPSNVC